MAAPDERSMSEVRHRVAVRWVDIDGLGHVNHALFLTYLEAGRDAWLESHGIPREEYVVGSINVVYRREVGADVAEVETSCVGSRVGRSSLGTRERVLDLEGGVYAEAEVGLVLWSAETRSSRPLTEAERASVEHELSDDRSIEERPR
jgi:acyl-CoA thioesterase FadM